MLTTTLNVSRGDVLVRARVLEEVDRHVGRHEGVGCLMPHSIEINVYRNSNSVLLNCQP